MYNVTQVTLFQLTAVHVRYLCSDSEYDLKNIEFPQEVDMNKRSAYSWHYSLTKEMNSE
jgi:hypothetical protein